MKLTEKTVEKVRNALITAKLNFRAMLNKGEKLKVVITKGNRKIGKTHNVSLPPYLTCGKQCEKCGCKYLCYDARACLQYTNVCNARAKNLAILEHNINDYFGQIDNYIIKTRKNKYFRFHVGGDIPNYEYFCKMVELAKKHEDWVFWTYTKKYDIVNKYCKEHGNTKKAIPQNLSIMFSKWDGLKMVNPFEFAEFRFIPKTDINKPKTIDIINKGLKCNGNCQECIHRHEHCITNQTTYVIEH